MTTPEDAVRDLVWAIHSPSLIRPSLMTPNVRSPADRTASPNVEVLDPSRQTRGFVRQAGSDGQNSALSETCSLDGTCTPVEVGESIDADELKTFLAQVPTSRVGVYFEQLIEFWLRRVLKLTAVERGIQIQDEKRTAGELDFVFRDSDGKLTHLETAVKFYLHQYEGERSPSSAESLLIGPNANDTFEKKMTRMFQHQFVLGRTSRPQLDRQLALVKGRIFYHPTDTTAAPSVQDSAWPARLAPDHLRGVWIRDSELWRLNTHASTVRYQIIEKPYWLAPRRVPTQAESLWDRHELQRQLGRRFAQRSRALLVSVLASEGEFAVETERFFVVDEAWPGRGRL